MSDRKFKGELSQNIEYQRNLHKERKEKYKNRNPTTAEKMAGGAIGVGAEVVYNGLGPCIGLPPAPVGTLLVAPAAIKGAKSATNSAAEFKHNRKDNKAFRKNKNKAKYQAFDLVNEDKKKYDKEVEHQKNLPLKYDDKLMPKPMKSVLAMNNAMANGMMFFATGDGKHLDNALLGSEAKKKEVPKRVEKYPEKRLVRNHNAEKPMFLTKDDMEDSTKHSTGMFANRNLNQYQRGAGEHLRVVDTKKSTSKPFSMSQFSKGNKRLNKYGKPKGRGKGMQRTLQSEHQHRSNQEFLANNTTRQDDSIFHAGLFGSFGNQFHHDDM